MLVMYYVDHIPDVVILISPSPAADGESLSHFFHFSPSAPPSKRTALPWTWIILSQSDRVCLSTLLYLKQIPSPIERNQSISGVGECDA